MRRQLLLISLLSLVYMGCSDDSGDAAGSSCGNRTIDGSEACDDGNREDGEGCASDCTRVEQGWKCESAGKACVQICGNSKLDEGEACDDGNLNDKDGCSSDCTRVEQGWKCETAGKSCELLCGNGELDEGEACDDGNRGGKDGCSEECKIEDHYRCPEPGKACQPMSCGNNIVEKENGESCDDGVLNVEYGFEGMCSTVCQPSHYCGDGLFDGVDRDNGEECDAGHDTGDVYDGCTAECKRKIFCGDGIIQPDHEQCDDGNDVANDGCTQCIIDENWICKTENGKSTCTEIECGNRVLNAANGETCDDGNRKNGDGCSSSCQVETGAVCVQNNDGLSVCTLTCGDGHIDAETGETCDDGNRESGDGCSANCILESGYTCDEKACFAKACGDGIIAGSEQCDDGNDKSGDGCSKYCQRERDYHCDEAGKPCAADDCGDGVLTGDETCDEGDKVNPANKTAGCVKCQVQMGWKCPENGKSCEPAECGNGILEGAEQCEEKSECCVQCVLQDHCLCDSDGKNCVKGECGNGKLESGEECDDGDLIAGNGCSPDCKIEPIFSCYNGKCKATCGDGLTLTEAGEECDDGNLINGDGCSSHCTSEPGFICTKSENEKEPDVLNLPIIYRDFRAYHFNNTGIGDHGDYKDPTQNIGFFTQEAYDALPDHCKKPDLVPEGTYTPENTYRNRHWPIVGSPIPDFNGNGCYSYNKCTNVVYSELNEYGRPMLRPATDMQWTDTNPQDETCAQLYTCPEIFDYWYKDSDMSLTIKDTLPLKRVVVQNEDGTTTTNYQFVYTQAGYSAENFWPLDGKGFHAEDAASLYGVREDAYGLFTSEFQTYFKYKGGEKLRFEGDDDVWVFFNGHLALEFAGIHGNWGQEVTLVDGPATKANEKNAREFGMYPGGIYSLQMFHAERCQGGSTYTLTLSGFVNMGTSECGSVCGDGLVRGLEECDFEGNHNDTALQDKAGCNADCTVKQVCGNGKIEKGEACEPDGTNGDWCENCKIKTCGDGKFNPEHEKCDLSAPASSVNHHENCQETCLFAGCGDGYLDPGEECDDGNRSDDDMCTHECKHPVCGDHIVSPGEACDDGVNNGAYGGCGFACAYQAPRCGDGIVDRLSGEECDEGSAGNKGGYGLCNSNCRYSEFCGDGVVQAKFEQCDPKDENGPACSSACTFVVN